MTSNPRRRDVKPGTVAVDLGETEQIPAFEQPALLPFSLTADDRGRAMNDSNGHFDVEGLTARCGILGA